jgi:hypothetical protein
VPAIPIPSVALPPASPFVGSVASPAPVRGTFAPPQNPFMASNGVSEIHNDGWQTDAYRWDGPLGRDLVTTSAYLPPARDCGSVTFDGSGRVISICIGATGPELYMFDPVTLATVATFSLPPRTAEDVTLNPNLFQDFSGGGYFYLDHAGDVVTGTTTRHIYVIGEPRGGGFRLVHDYDLSGVLRSDEEITSQLPDAHGLLWFTARRDGVVGTLNFATGAVHVLRLGSGSSGEITKSLAVDSSGGVYIPTNRLLYRFVAGAGGVPRVSWSASYPNTGVAKVGQLDAGTGTTPVISGPYVAINDNADPMDVVVYRTAVHPTRVVGHGRRRVRRRVPLGRTVCRVPVFTRGASADENALIAAGRSFVIENNSGYVTPLSTSAGALTAPGFARIEVAPNGLSCRLVWTNTVTRAASVVSKLSLADGLIYTYTIEPGLTDPWYWTALSFKTGRVVWKRYAGAGTLFNNNYAGISISPGGVAYLGVLGGLISLRDT